MCVHKVFAVENEVDMWQEVLTRPGLAFSVFFAAGKMMCIARGRFHLLKPLFSGHFKHTTYDYLCIVLRRYSYWQDDSQVRVM